MFSVGQKFGKGSAEWFEPGVFDAVPDNGWGWNGSVLEKLWTAWDSTAISPRGLSL